jgi:hypothetical protein
MMNVGTDSTFYLILKYRTDGPMMAVNDQNI